MATDRSRAISISFLLALAFMRRGMTIKVSLGGRSQSEGCQWEGVNGRGVSGMGGQWRGRGFLSAPRGGWPLFYVGHFWVFFGGS